MNSVKLIIKYELNYAKRSLLTGIPIIAGLAGYAYLREFNPLNLFTFTIFILISSSMFMNNFKENRWRMLCSLPVSNFKLALTRLLSIGVVFAVLFSLSGIIHALGKAEVSGFKDSTFELLMFGGIGLNAILFYFMLSIVGIFNTILIRSEDIGSWKNYAGWIMLIIAAADTIMVVRKFIRGKNAEK